jgi:hypothetical protein
MQLTPGDRKILGITCAIFFLMVVAVVVLNRGADSKAEVPSIYSTASGGSKAACLLLKESGYQTTSWEQPMTDLPDGKGKVLILLEPVGYPTKEERQQLQNFLRSGGRVLAAGRFAAFYLPENESVLQPSVTSSWERVPAVGLSPITRAAPEITLTPNAYWRVDKSGVALYGDPTKPSVIEYKIGEGNVLWLASATPFTNIGLKEAGNLEFMLAAVGKPLETQVLWDEYVHGYQRSPASHTTQRIIQWITFQLAICAITVLLTFSRRSSAVWLPASEVRLSPLEFVLTLGTLYDHADATSVAVEIYYQRFRYLLTRRLGLPVNCPVEDLDRAVSRRWNLHDEEFVETLRECESYRYDPAVSRQTALRLVQTLFGYAERLQLVASSPQEKKAWKRS